MLTFRCARSAALSATWLGAVVTLSAIIWSATWTPAYADGIIFGGCTGSRGSFNCVTRWGEAGDPYVRTIPEPVSPAEREYAAERDHKWLSRCHPVVVPDRYGVPRYHYAAPSCEFGVAE